MKWGAVVGITIVMILIALFEWPKLRKNSQGSQDGQGNQGKPQSQGGQGDYGSQGNQDQPGKGSKKDKAAFLSLTILAWGLGSIMVFYPDMPGPTELIDMLFKPLGRLLE